MIQSMRRVALALSAMALFGAVFAASAFAAVEVTTEAPTEITETKATLHTTVKTENREMLVGFEYGSTEESGGGMEGSKLIPAGSGTVKVSMRAEGLTPGALYYVRAVAYVFSEKAGRYGKYLTLDTFQRPRFQAPSFYVGIDGALDKETKFEVFEAGEATASCTLMNIQSGTTGGTPALPIPAAFGGCTFGGNAATVKMNSCGYVLNVANAGPPYTGTTSISCTKAGDTIEVASAGFCTVKIPAQTPGGSASYETVGEGTGRRVHAQIAGSGLTYSKEGPFCFLVGGSGTFGGSIHLWREFYGTFYMAGEKLTSLSVVGEESAEEAKQPKLEAYEYPATISGELDSKTNFKIFEAGEGAATCSSAKISAQIGSSVSVLPVATEFSGCTFGGSAATVKMNSCSYVLNVANAGPPYTGTTSISCTKAGETIEVASAGFCTVWIPAQTPSGSTSYESQGEGGEPNGRHVHAQVSGSGLTYTKEGPFCFLVGGSGKFGGGFSLSQNK